MRDSVITEWCKFIFSVVTIIIGGFLPSSRYRCLDDHGAENVVFMLKRAIYNFVSESRYVRTVDGFLVILGTLVSEVEEVASVTGLSAETVLNMVFECDEIAESLRPLAKYINEVEYLVSTNPRHRKLRTYLSLITSYLSELTPTPVKLAITRPSMRELESVDRVSHDEVIKPSQFKDEREVGRGVLSKSTAEEDYEWMKPTRRRIGRARGVRLIKRALPVLLVLIILTSLVLLYNFIVEPIKNLIGNISRFVNEITKEPSVSDIKMSVLNELNRIRAEHGLPPVKLMNSSIAQYRADDMVRKRYFGHCDLDGLPTTYYYTSLGGVYAMEENVGYMGKCSGIVVPTEPASISAREALEYASRSLKDMVYNDESSNWGHRNSLLDPTNNYVDIGVAWDKGVFILVLQMNKVWVSWSNPPVYVNNVFKACGRLLLNNSKVTQVIIYKYRASSEITSSLWSHVLFSPCKTVNYTCTSYSHGSPVAGVIPPYYEGRYIGIENIVATEWAQYRDYFCIEFTWKPRETGIYTIVIFAENTLNILHPYDQERYKHYLPILEYTFKNPCYSLSSRAQHHNTGEKHSLGGNIHLIVETLPRTICVLEATVVTPSTIKLGASSTFATSLRTGTLFKIKDTDFLTHLH